MMISFSSMNLMVSVCKWFVLLMWLLKCQWRSEKKTFPLFLNFILTERNAEGKYHTRIRGFSVNFVYKKHLAEHCQ